MSQGDPLSPFLFVLTVEVLNLMIKRATDLNLWSGLEVGNHGTRLTHLQYADNTIIFSPQNLNYLHNIKKTLILFQLSSGLKINFHKSEILGINISNNWLNVAAANLFCRVGSFPITYLGLPIGGIVSRLKLWDPLIERMNSKLATWKEKLLSIGGRLTLIKASLSNLLMYFMSLFPVPVGVVEKIKKIQRSFLWSGVMDKKSLALVRWDVVQLPKKLGGLNVSNTLNRNLGLLIKWVWRYFQEPNSLWREIIRQKYKYPPTLTMMDISTVNKGGPWKAICNHLLKNPIARNLLHTGFRMKIWNREDTYFWHSLWLSDTVLKSSFPRLFSISGLPLAKVASMGLWRDGLWVWDPPWTRPLRPRDVDEWAALSALLNQVSLSPIEKDELIWIHHKTGTFSVKSFYEEFAKNSEAQLVLVAKKIWKNLIPHRIEIFLWLALLGKIATKSKLAHMNIIPPSKNLCPFCKSGPEDVAHLMIHCIFSQAIWAWWLGLWELNWVWPENLELAFSQWHFPGKNSFFKKLWIASFMVIVVVSIERTEQHNFQ